MVFRLLEFIILTASTYRFLSYVEIRVLYCIVVGLRLFGAIEKCDVGLLLHFNLNLGRLELFKINLVIKLVVDVVAQ